jgi:hypothetical protein
MTIIFDTHAGEVYIEEIDPRSSKPHERSYYYKPDKGVSEKDRVIVRKLREIYNLGQRHRTLEIRNVLGF